jgi:hypothetical protein
MELFRVKKKAEVQPNKYGEPTGTVGAPMMLYTGPVVNPHRIKHDVTDMTNAPSTRVSVGNVAGIQLFNGWCFTSARRSTLPGAGYLDVTMPRLPGQTRQGNPNRTNYMPHGAAPSQWRAAANSGVGANTPPNPGGPGQMLNGATLTNPGTGG